MKIKQKSKSTKKSYSPFEKRKIVEEVRSGFYSLKQARKKYILSKTKFSKWNRWYFKIRLLRHFTPNPSAIMKNSDQQVKHLKKQLLEAQAQLDKLQLKNTVLETMIDIAEKQLKVDIRKKSGSRQSKK
jgi:transposase-like protein